LFQKPWQVRRGYRVQRRGCGISGWRVSRHIILQSPSLRRSTEGKRCLSAPYGRRLQIQYRERERQDSTLQ
jgi:hypothetical protein